MKAWEITKKDLRILLRDARALVVLLVLPLVFITIIGLTMGKILGWKNTNQVLRVGVVDAVAYEQIGQAGWDEDAPEAAPAGAKTDKTGEAAKTPADKVAESNGTTTASSNEPAETLDAEEKIKQKKIARNIIVKVINELQERGGFEIKEILTPDRAENEVNNGTVNAALVIGPNFYRQVSRLKPGDILDNQLKDGLGSLDVALVTREPDSSTHSLIEQLAFSVIFKTIVPPVMCRHALHRRFMSTTCAQFDEEGDKPNLQPEASTPRPVVHSDEIYNAIVPSYTVFFVFFIVSFMARSVLHEREQGTLRRLRIAPVRPMSILSGKTMPFLVLSIAQTALLFLCGRIIFDFSWGTYPLMLLPVIFCTSLAATALGLLVATCVRSESQVSAYATILVITMGGVSGCFTPRKWLPDAMREFSLTTPHAWSLMAYEELLSKASPDPRLVFECCVMLVAFSVVFFIAGSMRFQSVE
ncbi:MAG TPA: ABC transporter permease [Planctomycetaceae bacterium]|jgi:ABC-2 type transport system permease protein|nr:ABC transporter permease [Planctomycetaceae bacterium]